MAANHLNVDQVAFVTAMLAPHFGPMIDRASEKTWSDDIEVAMAEARKAAAAAFLAYEPALRLIVAECDGQVPEFASKDDIKARAGSIFTTTFEQFDGEMLCGVVLAELQKHSRVLRGDAPND